METYTKIDRLNQYSKKIISFCKECKEYIVLALFALLVFLYGTYRLSEVGQPILFDDEFGYWSASSFFLGIDWSALTGKIGYYSYGYGLLLIPIRLLGRLLYWSWSSLYQGAVVLNAAMLVGSYFLALKLCRRYFTNLNWIVRSVVCFAAIIYPSNIVFSHITWTENTLTFFFWLFLYVLMRCLDNPSVKNHAALAIVAFYLYVVHQRALSIVLTSILIVIYINFLKINRLKHTASFFGSMYVCSLIHSMIKGKLQNDFYLGNEPAGLKTTLGYAFRTKTFVLLLGIVVVLFILYLWEKEKTKLVLGILGVAAAGLALVLIYGIGNGMVGTGNGAPSRIANNDFAGQWYKIKGIFSINGLIRLGISMVGKWFYLVAGTGLVICWGMKESIKNAFWMLLHSIKRTEYVYDKKNIWLFGVCMAWISTFMVNAIYKEGFYKVDDLVNGRYNEYVIGILLIYSFHVLLEDKNWIRTLVICVVLFILAGVFCQRAFDEVGRTDFELCHSVMFGRVFWNWEVPTGKVKQISGYILPMGLAFICIVKLCSAKFPKAMTVRCVAGLLVPILAWSYLTGSILENYVISRNEKQAVAMPTVSRWITLLGWDKKVYYLEDTQNYRWAEGIQFMVQNNPVILTNTTEVSWDEDAFFIMNRSYAKSEIVQEKCEIIAQAGQLALVAPKDKTIVERWKKYTLN